jgi:hypothetical protein
MIGVILIMAIAGNADDGCDMAESMRRAHPQQGADHCRVFEGAEFLNHE